MRIIWFGITALLGALILSSCSLLPFDAGGGPLDDTHQEGDSRMAEIADAVNSGDASALKALFSGPAVEQSADIDDGIDYFLSVFPHGALSWKRISVNSEGENSSGQRTELVQANYKVSVDGEDYWVFFADFTINDLIDPGNVGLYALGVTPWTDDPDSGESKPFYDWAGSIHYDVTEPPGYPGVYVPS